MTAPSYHEQDPFDLPDWLGEAEVVWTTPHGVRHGHHVAGMLTGAGHDDVPCDLLAVDDAYPEPVANDALRVRAHQLWRHGEVLVAAEDARILLAVPGTRVDLQTAVDAVARLARAVGAGPGSYAVLVRVS